VPALRRAYVAAAIVWTIALPLAPWIASRAHTSRGASLLALAVYGIGSFVCHQLRDRSFHLWSAQLPVCARCTGIYFGAAIGALLWVARAFPAYALRASAWRAGAPSARRRQASAPAAPIVRSPNRLRQGYGGPPKLRAKSERLALPAGVMSGGVLALAALPSFATLVYEWTIGVAPSNSIRFAAGLPLGVVVSWLVLRPVDVPSVALSSSKVG
jgi:uncharacterized membrane protein